MALCLSVAQIQNLKKDFNLALVLCQVALSVKALLSATLSSFNVPFYFHLV